LLRGRLRALRVRIAARPSLGWVVPGSPAARFTLAPPAGGSRPPTCWASPRTRRCGSRSTGLSSWPSYPTRANRPVQPCGQSVRAMRAVQGVAVLALAPL